MCMYNWFTLLHTWNEYSIVNQLYSNTNFFLKDESVMNTTSIYYYMKLQNYQAQQFLVGA